MLLITWSRDRGYCFANSKAAFRSGFILSCASDYFAIDCAVASAVRLKSAKLKNKHQGPDSPERFNRSLATATLAPYAS